MYKRPSELVRFSLIFFFAFYSQGVFSSNQGGNDSTPGHGKKFGLHLPAPTTDADFHDNGSPNMKKVELGKQLFFDKVLSGNKNIACATCHHALTDTGDGLSLPVGEGARGLGVTRDTGSESSAIVERVPRNAPPVFNLGARQFWRMLHDGRVAVDPAQPSGFQTPAGDDFPLSLENVLAAQAMFPVVAPTEMAGQVGKIQLRMLQQLGNSPALGVFGINSQID